MRGMLLRYHFLAPDGTRACPVGRDEFMRVGRAWDRKYGAKKWTVLDRAELVDARGDEVRVFCKSAINHTA